MNKILEQINEIYSYDPGNLSWDDASKINLTDLEKKILSKYEYDLSESIANGLWCTHDWREKDLLENATRERGALSSLTQKGIIEWGCEGWILGELGIRCLILHCLEKGTLEKHI
tara:strand:- start:171 stop:515 length:345 start_codon:yes stop_codon:yes gene_type:complete